MNKYPTYKNSGVDWLGEIPEHWEVRKLKFLGYIYAGISGKKGDDFSKDNNGKMKPFIPFTNICNNAKIDNNQFQYVNIAESENQNRVKKNDILFLMSSETLDDIAKNSIYLGNENELYLNSFCKGFRITSDEINPEFFNYLFISKVYRNYFSLVGRGFTRINLKQEYINDAYTIIPPLPEQQKIAQFLDEKTAKIDLAIAQKEKMIALLKERKQIVIQNAVTGKWSMVNGEWSMDNGEWSMINGEWSMTPKSKLKDSGVEWIGEIPEHWEVKKLFGICRFVRGNSTFSKDEMLSNGEYVAVQYGKSYQVNEINEKYEFYINSEFYKDSQIVNQGDTIFVSTSETIEDLGHSVFYNRSDLGLLGGEQMLLKPNLELIDSKYLFYSSRVFAKELRKFATGIKVNRFNINDIKTIYISIPPIQDQTAIVAHIEAQSAKIDQAIALQEQQIAKLKEYKATLIDSAVTGKIMVND
ncbi:MAG: restriction endonuclease subunit S [Chitinophagales bacterium]|nr:restriction endonuclease subunit S [Chitinophagales bacterium]